MLRIACLIALLLAPSWGNAASGKKSLNVLILTLDDMGWGTAGFEGCSVPDITPNLDRLAKQGMHFTHGYVMVPMCGPSRAALLTGRYPHCSGMMGHGNQPPPLWQDPTLKTTSLSNYLHDQGYRTGAILKYSRSGYLNTWDVTYDEGPNGTGFHDRNPDSFYQRTKAFIARAEALNQPFFLYANPVDPHDPWPGTKWEKVELDLYNPNHPFPDPERRYKPGDVDVPAFLPDLAVVREGLAPYYESLRRGDACVGAVLKALEESGQADNTLVIFLSDNGIGVPGAKNTLYPHGVRTPILIKWPGRIEAGIKDEQSIVSAIDLMPTIIEACGLPQVKGIEGRSILDVATGQKKQTDRTHALTTFDYWNDSTEKHHYPQRSIVDRDYCYIWNAYVQRYGEQKVVPMPWNDVIQPVPGRDEVIEERIAYYMNRPVEEFFDLKKDPGCWNNLIDDPAYQEEIERYRAILKKEMEQSADPERHVYGAGS